MKTLNAKKYQLVAFSIALTSALIFVADMSTGVWRDEEFLYIIPILFTLWIPRRKVTIITAISCTLLTIIGLLRLAIVLDVTITSSHNINRVYSLIGISLTTYVVLKNKVNQKVIQKNVVTLSELVKELKISNADLEQYAYVASHDLQEPLRNITNYIGLLEKRLEPTTDEVTRDFMRRIVNSADRMKNLVRDVLLYSLIGKNRHVKKVDFGKVLDVVLADMASFVQENEAKIIADKLPVLDSCESEVTQLFQNLISNAIKFRRKEVLPEIHIHCKEDVSEWQFSVEDNGIGIEQQYFDKLFQVFQRLHSKNGYSGTGIGLAICKKIIQMHGGKIWVDSKPGIGSVFYFTIPKIELPNEEN